MPAINGDWLEALKGEFGKTYYRDLFEKVNEEYRTRQIFPPANDVFNAFHWTPLKDVKVVIFGQDPYHGENQAHGLCFSVKPRIFCISDILLFSQPRPSTSTPPALG